MPTSERRPHVMIVDDDAELCELLAMRLEGAGYRVTTESLPGAVLARLGREHVDSMILDLRLGDVDGLDVLTEVRKRSPDLPVVVLTAHGTIDVAVEATRRGAYGFLTKPFLDHDVLQKLAHAVESFALRREVAGLRRVVGDRSDDRQLLGVSAAIARAREVVERIAPTDATVLISGESGTGKEIAARSLHALSPRARGPFIAINCAALAPDLLESALFGHVKGAFTGATSNREGVFGAARGGTLFLDEVAEASAAVQARLLRVLQERSYSRVGTNVEETADVRLVAASNRDLRAEVAARRFREDLFYRLHVVPLVMAPLRERREDIPVLAEVFLERAAARHGLPVPALSRGALDALLRHSWPGNVRELQNVVEATLLLARSATITEAHLPDLWDPTPSDAAVELEVPGAAASTDPAPPMPPLREARDAFERSYLTTLLQRTGGNITVAAGVAGRNRSDFYDLLRRHGLSPADFKPVPPG
ncbi:MAG: sigma-54 dependent transcriptional regulator [Deltaproteobacteria bacterium]|nr:sigma-54 dependent transcriptional regulator [Myxococcales bacterium]MDP3214823.1 sigma-54 dependent transcriptional regulator [Deltaproteobacteria bacterium]